MNQIYTTILRTNGSILPANVFAGYEPLYHTTQLGSRNPSKGFALNQPVSASYRFAIDALSLHRNVAPKCEVLIDFENLYIGLKQHGLPFDLKRVFEAIRALIADLGNNINIVAYADWGALCGQAEQAIQCELALLSVQICSVISRRGKNSSDMKIVDDIRTLMETDATSPNPPRKFVLVTGDSDFCTVVETSRSRGHEVIIVSLRSCLSRALEQVADEVRYLEELLTPQTKYLTSETTKLPTYAAVAMRIANHLHQRNWTWTYVNNLVLLPAEEEQVHQAIAAGILIRFERPVFWAGNSQHADIVTPNFEHPLVKAIYRLIEWLPDRIAYCLHKRHMPYVDSNFLARGMTLDNSLRQLGIGQNRQEAEDWLDLAASAGIIAKKQQSHPSSSAKNINTWWLPEEHRTPNLVNMRLPQSMDTVKPPDEAHNAKTPASNRIKNTISEPLKSSVREIPISGSYQAIFRRPITVMPISSLA